MENNSLIKRLFNENNYYGIMVRSENKIPKNTLINKIISRKAIGGLEQLCVKIKITWN